MHWKYFFWRETVPWDRVRSCPYCGGRNLELWHNLTARFPNVYQIACGDCLFVGRQKVFLWRAIRSWNRERRKDQHESDKTS